MILQFIVDKWSVYCPLGVGQNQQTKPPLATVSKHPTEGYVFIAIQKEKCGGAVILIYTK